MKNKIPFLLLAFIMICSSSVYAQNSPFSIWGGGLNGSTYQQTAIYTEMPYGLVIEAPLDPNGQKLPIQFNWRGGGKSSIKILPNGNVGIGIETPGETLSVNGNIPAKEIKVEAANWPDYVFEKNYNLVKLDALESYIKTNKHLPNMPSAKEAETKGVELGNMVKQLLKNQEELTLHLIDQQKKIGELQKTIIRQQEIINKIK